MRKNWKKGMAGMLSVCLLATCVPGVSELGSFVHTDKTVQAATSDNVVSGTCGKKVTWKYNKKTKVLTFSGSGKMNSELKCNNGEWGNYKKQVKKVIIGNKITEIARNEFKNWSNLQEVQFGTGVKVVGHYAFYGCESLKKIELGGKIEEIGIAAFANCNNLTDAYIGKNVKLVWWNLFKGCTSLKNIGIDEKNTNIIAEGNSVKNAGLTGACGEPFYGSYGVKYTYNQKTKTLTISGNGRMYIGSGWSDLTSSGYYNFLSKSPHEKLIKQNMEKLIIGDGITSIGKWAFADCKALKEVKLGKNVKNIEVRAFKNCTALKTINLTDNIETIEDAAFASCKKLEKIYLGKSLKWIPDNTFFGCSNLKQIKVHKSNKKYSVKGNMLLNKKQTKVVLGAYGSDTTCHIPGSVETLNTYAINMKTIENFEVSSKNKTYSSKNGLLYSKNGKTLYQCPMGKKGTATVSAKVTTLDYDAFKNCSKLEKIIIGKNIKNLSGGVFFGCNNLKTIQINKENKYYTSKDGAVFTKKNNTLDFCYAPVNGTYTVPEGVTSIDSHAFYYCMNLKHLVLSDDITNYKPVAGAYNSKKQKLESITLGKSYDNKEDVQFLAEFPYLKNIYVSEENPYYSSVDGILYNKEQTKLLACPSNKEVCKMPDTVTVIQKDAFFENAKIKELYVSDGVMAVVDELNKCTGLKKLYLGKSVKAVNRTLQENLEQISIHPENSYYKVEDGVLYTKDGRCLVWCPEQRQGTVTIASGTAIIGEEAFYGCGKVTDVVIPATVTIIEENALGHEYRTEMTNSVFWVPAGMKEYYENLFTSKTGFKSGMVIKEMEQ